MKNEVEHKSYHYWDFAGQITAQLNQTYLLLGGVMLVAAAEVVCIFLLTRQVQHSPISYEPPRMQFLPTAEMPLLSQRPGPKGPGLQGKSSKPPLTRPLEKDQYTIPKNV